MRAYHPAIALNRFGLGARANEPLPADPQAHLLAQFARYEARPAALASAPASAAMAEILASYFADRRANGGVAKDDETSRMAIRRMVREGYAEAGRLRVEAALTTAAPFPERLVHFWANHFAVSADKLQTLGLAGAFEFEAIRPNIGGSFADLLLAAVRHPAMLLYLDQAQSIGPNSALGERAQRLPVKRKVGLNENLAREILELHTLGVGGGYTQADVTELARAMTGWSLGGFVRRPLGEEAPAGAFVWQAAWHEPGARTLLGRRYGEAGEDQARRMLNDLALHPATARHISTKLARHFVADVPPPALVARLETAFLKSGGDLPTLSRTLVEAPESWEQPLAKFKSPWDWLISALRATGVTRLPGQGVVQGLGELGQPLWRPGSPAGFPDTQDGWAAPDALLRRVEAADRIAASAGQQDARSLAPQILPAVLSGQTSEGLARADGPRQALALLLSAPEFMRR